MLKPYPVRSSSFDKGIKDRQKSNGYRESL